MKCYFMAALASVLALTACSQKASQQQKVDLTPSLDTYKGTVIASEPRNVVAMASAFKMSGPYQDKVAVTLNGNGELAYFPGPSDITTISAPTEIGEGWWLNRQGLSANSVFTKWTFTEYAALKTVPSPAEIKAAIIPGACVTSFRELPITFSEACDRPSATLMEYLK